MIQQKADKIKTEKESQKNNFVWDAKKEKMWYTEYEM